MAEWKEMLEQLVQVINGAVWDGDLISKESRDQLLMEGLVQRVEGYNIITRKAIRLAVELGLLRGGMRDGAGS